MSASPPPRLGALAAAPGAASALTSAPPTQASAVPARSAARLRAAVGHALRQPDIRAKLEAEGRTVMQPVATQVEADAYLNLQVQRYGQLLKDIGRSPVR